jgi:hypothetical protein
MGSCTGSTQQLHKLVDFNGNLGGRIIRNKLWFYGGYRWVGYDREQLDAFYDDGSPILLNTWMPYHLEKLSYQATPGNRFTGFYHVAADHQRRGASRFVPAESRELAVGPVTLMKGEWQAVRGNSLVTSVQSGLYYDYEYTGMGNRQQGVDHRYRHVAADGRRPDRWETPAVQALSLQGRRELVQVGILGRQP